MRQPFFELTDDVQIPGRWHLDSPVDSEGTEVEDTRQFNRGRPVQVPGRLTVPIEHEGRPLDFTETNLKTPVVHARVASIFAELALDDVQLIPVDVQGQPDPYFILVATRLIKCIDEQASKVQFWTAEDGLPHKTGKYYAVDDLRIDKSKVGDARVFRTEGWAGTLIVSDDIKAAMERIGATGAKFVEV
ncbi:imm11 family protein [Pyxidicoccus xibeiensis]|uniref:imm11 family protein n=1 Tax=Pyxidicoccus xibeiensis TaxID=2906759 RepID=UPI0020A79A68|nr:DUF1629 domain-containing protein [Pyxidicoccus xibeiensis]MCP3143872.1 hypothetical protein [Pyxidicoccus xibeiensis]